MKPLLNVGASCFMNTTLQSLFASSYFNSEVLKALAADREATL